MTSVRAQVPDRVYLFERCVARIFQDTTADADLRPCSWIASASGISLYPVPVPGKAAQLKRTASWQDCPRAALILPKDQLQNAGAIRLLSVDCSENGTSPHELASNEEKIIDAAG
jgi:hypothetical protein